MEEKVFAGRTPALLIERQSSGGDQTMEIGVIGGALKATGVTVLDVASQGPLCGSAPRPHDFEMRNRQRMVAAICLAIARKISASSTPLLAAAGR